MAQLNPNIILQARSPDVMGAYGRGMALRDAQNEMQRKNALAQVMQEHGAGMMQGDQNALNALAQYDPQAALGLMGQQQGMKAQELNMQATRQRMRVLDENQARAVAQEAAKMDAAQRQAEALEIERGIKMGLAAKTPQEWDAMMAQLGQNDMIGQFANREMLAAQYMDVADILKGQSGQDDAPAAYDVLRRRANDAGLQPGTPEYQSFMLNAGGEPATFRALDMQAEAAGLQPGSPEYQQFMATRGAGLAAGAKTTATNLADIQTGGEAARVKAQGAAQGKADATSQSELTEMQRNMSSLMVVIDQLDDLADRATYTMAGRARDEVRKELGLEPTDAAIARAEYIAVVDNQVLPLLRQTFGAAFTVKEGETLRNTLGDANKSPQEKKAVLRAFIAQKERDLKAQGGTVPPQQKPDTPVINGTNVPDFSAMTDEQLDAWIAENGQ